MVKKTKTPEKKKEKSPSRKISDTSLKGVKNLSELKREYHITEDDITLKLLLDKIQERLEYYIKTLVQILQPEEFHSLQECMMFDDKEKSELFDLYKSMMILHREIAKSEVLNEDKDMTSMVELADAEMRGYKKHVIKIFSKMQDSWKKTDTKHAQRYFG